MQGQRKGKSAQFVNFRMLFDQGNGLFAMAGGGVSPVSLFGKLATYRWYLLAFG